MLAVFLATCVVVAGVVIVVQSQQGVPSSPGSAPGTQYSMYVEVRPHSGSMRTSQLRPTIRTPKPRPTLTVDAGCRPGAGPTQLPEVPAEVRRRVDAAWQRIETWLAGHAPATAATLAGPATPEQISAAQHGIGVPLPADLVASLLRHDGVTPGRPGTFTLPPFFEPLSAHGIGTEAAMMCEVLTSLGEDSAVGSWWHGQFVPVAVDNGGDSLFLDQRTGTGRLGRHYNEDTVSFDQGQASLTELLEQTADVLDGRRPVLGYSRPTVTPEGTLDWEIVR